MHARTRRAITRGGFVRGWKGAAVGSVIALLLPALSAMVGQVAESLGDGWAQVAEGVEALGDDADAGQSVGQVEGCL
jgi:hypothetical protein